ncbi:MAG: T3SS effector HopA1 family protein [Bacteroidota bacterium]
MDTRLTNDNFKRFTYKRTDNFELIPLHELPPKYSALAQELEVSKDCFAVLIPINNGYSIKVVNQAAYQFLKALHYEKYSVRKHWEAMAFDDLSYLLIEKVISVHISRMEVTGAAVFQHLESPTTLQHEKDSIELKAIRYAIALDILDARGLAERLYYFNRRPLNPALKERIDQYPKLSTYLELSDLNSLNSWIRVQEKKEPYWYAYAHLNYQKSYNIDKNYKIYINVPFEDFKSVLKQVVANLPSVGVIKFKFTGRMENLLRPDKFVIYCKETEHFHRTIAQLVEAIPATKPHEVPFTAKTPNALITWATDPSADAMALQMDRHKSWRVWVCQLIAKAVIDAKMEKIDHKFEYVLQRLNLQGLDHQTWTLHQNREDVERINTLAHGVPH